MYINLLAVNTSFENSSHAKVQSPEHRFTCPTSIGVAPLEVTQNLKEKSHIHHDPNPNGPMGNGMASQYSTITKSQKPRHRSALVPLNKATAVIDIANQRP